MVQSIPRERPTLKAVANAAGVSVATASRVLAGKRASPQAVAAVQAASRRLGYRPDPIARALRARSTGTFGVIVPELRNPFFADLIGAVEDVAQDEQMEVLVADSHGDAEHERHRLETLLNRRVDAILIVPADEEASVPAIELAAATLPVVQVDRFVRGVDIDYVGVDSHRGISELLRHLDDLGCRDLQFVSALPTNSSARTRRDAFDALAVEHGFNVAENLLGHFSVEFGRAVASDIADRPSLPHAVVCGSDVIAVGLMSEFGRLGIRVPDDVRITGFDDNVLAEVITPALTTLRQPVDAIAQEAVSGLLSRLAGNEGPSRHSIILPQLITRASTTGGLHE